MCGMAALSPPEQQVCSWATFCSAPGANLQQRLLVLELRLLCRQLACPLVERADLPSEAAQLSGCDRECARSLLELDVRASSTWRNRIERARQPAADRRLAWSSTAK